MLACSDVLLDRAGGQAHDPKKLAPLMREREREREREKNIKREREKEKYRDR